MSYSCTQMLSLGCRTGCSLRGLSVALIVLCPLLILPRMTQSRAVHALVTALLHHRGLVLVSTSMRHHSSSSSLLHCFSAASSSWVLLPVTTALSTWLNHCITTALSSSWLHCLYSASSSSPLLCSTMALSSWLLLCITAASCIGLFLRFTTAPCSSMLQCVSSASSSSWYHCISMALSFELLPDMSPSLHHLGLGLLSPSPLAATFSWTFQPGGCGLLLRDPLRAILPGWDRHISTDDPPLGVVAAPSCSAPDDPVRGVSPPLVPG